MAQRKVRVEYPRSEPDKFIDTGDKFIKKHYDNPSESPFSDGEIEEFADSLEDARKLREKADKLKREAEALMEQARIKLGIGKGQSAQIKGTANFMLNGFKKTLLGKHQGEEEKLSEWAFNVVVTYVTTRRKKE